MLVRVVLVLCAVLLIIGATAALTLPAGPPPSDVPTAPVAAATSRLDEVRRRLPSREPVPATVGEVVELQVRAERQDVVRIPRLRLSAPVGPGVDGVLRFVAERPGRYAVRTTFYPRRLGTVVVEPAGG